ncbi:amino acid ABC transporter permease, partial [Streptomyces decoyicus]
MLKTEAARDGADGGYVPSARRIERERVKRARTRRATAVAALSTLVTAV